jgi:ubiquinone/menaquinone biosynthesis C-methylase UbiE
MTHMNQDLIWDYFQNDVPESFAGSKGRLAFLARQLKPGERVLNIGVGSGYFEEVALGLGYEVYSLDPIAKSIESIQKRLKLADKARVGYGQSMPFEDQFFDAVIISEVIEHLEPIISQDVIREIARVLKPGGRIIGTVPSREIMRLNYVMCPHCGQPFHRWGHQQSFKPEDIVMLLTSKFDVIQLTERPFITWSEYNWKGKLVSSLKMFLWRLGIHGQNEHILFIAARR